MRQPSEYEQFESFVAEPPERQQAFIWWELKRMNGKLATSVDRLTDLVPRVEEIEGFVEAEVTSRKARQAGADWTIKVMLAFVAAGQLLIAAIVAVTS